MRAHAIVIGIDRYQKPEWSLDGAVRDAIAFARWAVTSGGVDANDLTLLLSTADGDTPLAAGDPLQARVQPADWKHIAGTLHRYRKNAGRDADRLWFYYGGHGLAPPMQAPDAGPLVVPSDVDDLDFYTTTQPLGLETFRAWMENVGPKEQFFFVDACRDVLPASDNKFLGQQVLWDLRGIDDDMLATQAVFLATTAGQRAKEIRGHGLFGRALVAALRGLGPQLRPTPPTPGKPARRRLLFDDLVEFVRDAVARGIKEIPGVQPADQKSVPYARVTRLTGDIPVAEFAPEKLPRVKVDALVDPEDARTTGRIEFLQWSDEREEWIARAENPKPAGPPLDEMATFEVRGGSHHLRITANVYEDDVREILVYEEKRYPIELRRKTAAATPVEEAAEELEMVADEGDFGDTGATARKVWRSAPHATTGSVELTCPDSLAQVALIDGGGRERGRAHGTLQVKELAPGPYKAVAELAGAPRAEEMVMVEAGRTTPVHLHIAAPPSAHTAAVLQANQIGVHNGYAFPSENFGEVANVRLASLLAYAAWGARWPDWAGFHHVRSLGVDPLAGLDPAACAVQVLVGDAAENAAVDTCSVQIEPGGPLTLAPLHGVPARQGAKVLPPGTARVRVSVPGFAAASFALALLPGFVTLLVVAREADGDIEVQQHFNPIDPTVGGASTLDVRFVELAQRALEERQALTAFELEALLREPSTNPMLAVLTGYRALRGGLAAEFRGSAFWNVLQRLPMLPDADVLAGLYDESERAAHFERAAERGTPIVAEGFWALIEWVSARAIAKDLPPPELREHVLPGTIWTGFVDAPRAPRIEGVHAVATTGRSYVGAADENRVLAQVARSVARVQGVTRLFAASTFLVAPRLVLVPIHVAEAFAGEVEVQFDPHDAASTRRVSRVLKTLRPDPPLAAGEPHRDLLEISWPVLVELDEDAGVPPLTIADAAPEVGDRVAVIGFPQSTGALPAETFAHYFSGSSGDKHAMPGPVLRASAERWSVDYGCFTAAGTGGGAVIDLESGKLVAMHIAGVPVPEQRKVGVGIGLWHFAEALRQ